MRKASAIMAGLMIIAVGCQKTPQPTKFPAPFLVDEPASSASQDPSPDCQMGIDFWKSGRLHVPDYRLCRNLIQNPSFEAGLHYYAGALRFYITDEGQARFGNRSLLIHAVKGMARPSALATFAIPLIEGKTYTFSCYVKGDKPKGLRLDLESVSARWLVFPRIGSCNVTPEWTRQHFSFTAPNNAISINIRGEYYGADPSGEGRIWVDGLQLEEGGMTDYVEKPVSAQLLTSNPENFLTPKDKLNARLRITSHPNSAGRVALEVQDFYYHVLWQGRLPFRTNAKGVAELPLPLDGKLPRGIFVVRTDFTLEDNPMAPGAPFKDTDYFRIAIMDPLKNEHRNKDIIAHGLPRTAAVLARFQAIGIGATSYGMVTQEDLARLKQYNFGYSGFCIMDDHKKGSINVGTNCLVENLVTLAEVTPEMEKKVEDACYEKAKSLPWINLWWFSGESEWRFDLLKQNNFKDFAKLLIAAYRGVKRFNPNAMVLLEGGPCNMMPQGGTRLVDQYLEAVGGQVKFDGVAIHPYRTVPEDPDLDDDAAVFFEVLKKHGYDHCPVYWNEGIYYTPYIIPAWGLDSHKGCSTDHYLTGCPSYHMGWGERIAAAYHARSWLVGLKYQDWVKVFNGWGSITMSMDTDMTPFAAQKIPNTLGHLLGNAYFKEDIRFAPKVRCYVFEDEKKRPVAAVWSHIAKVDRGEEQCPTAEITFFGSVPEFFDLMEAPIPAVADREGKCRVEVSSFPLFIRGKPGTLASLCQALRSARLADRNESLIDVSVKPVGRSDLDIKFRNLVSRPMQADIILSVQGKQWEKPLSLPEKGTATMKVPMPQALGFDRVTKVQVPVTIREKNSPEVKLDVSFEGFSVKKWTGAPIIIDGDLSDWKGIPEIPITNCCLSKPQFAKDEEPVGYPGDLGATFQAAWDDEMLYLAVKVVDDKFVHEKKAGWDNDCLQMYIDTMCDARSKVTKGFDGNDYSYDFFPDVKEGTAVVFRRFAPEQQAAGGLAAPKPNELEPNIKTAFRLYEGGYLYEIAIPKQYLAPMKLEAGTVAGMALYVADRDNRHVKNAVTLTPPGMGGYMNPHLYPAMVLVE